MDALRDGGLVALSLVAEDGGLVVGSVVFSPMTIEGAAGGLRSVGLAPLAVIPEYQGTGVGSALARRGIELCREAGFDLMTVYGSTAYYSRFGFVLAEAMNLHPADAGIELSHFQALVLRGEAPNGPLHLAYPPQFFME